MLFHSIKSKMPDYTINKVTTNNMQNQLKKLKEQAHTLKPIIIVGHNGLSEQVKNEVEIALEAHELVKIRINTDGPENKENIIAELLKTNNTTLIQKIGHTLVLYRKAKK